MIACVNRAIRFPDGAALADHVRQVHLPKPWPLTALERELAEVLAMWVEDPVNCASVRTEAAPREWCGCWACERTRQAQAALKKLEGRS